MQYKSISNNKKKNVLKRISALVCAMTVTITGIPSTGITAQAADEYPYSTANVMLDHGGYKTEPLGVGTDNWGGTYNPRTATLPPSTTYLTDHYRETVGTVPTSDWASSVVFDKYSEALYAHPLAYRAASNGMQMASPAVTSVTSGIDGEPQVESLLKDDTVELVVGADGFTAKDARVDKTTDWAYEILMESDNGNGSMRATVAKGTPYAYYTFEDLSPTISLGAGATNLSIYKNDTSSNILGISLKNKKDGKTHYYGVYAPEGTTWKNAGGKLTANLPSDGNYLSVAILPDNTDEAFRTYEQYAFNFITDTKVEWEYHENASKVYTRYNVTTTNMETGKEGGDTIIALYPHQWRYLYEDSVTDYTYETIRGTMKTVVGSSYITEMAYHGIVTGLPVTTDNSSLGQIKEQLGYLYDYRKNKEDPKWICWFEGQYSGYDTYWVGKNLNTMTEAIFLAEQFPDDAAITAMKNDMVAGVANYLQFWFNPGDLYVNGDTVDSYFYYHKDYGTLIGYPASYSTDKEVNDHHFHYGYWIKAAAAIAMNDPDWADNWGDMVYEMIGDIANANRDGSSYNENSDTRYPFLRNFDIYEGHSWASGVANYEYDENGNMIDAGGGLSGGNNQESSSEAVNAWASLILWGEAVGDTRIRDLGVYLYTTEIAAVEEYYYDVHDEVFTDEYEDRGNYNIQTVTRLFGGRYDHTAWWTENSIEVTTITMLPLTGATLYMGRYKDKVKAVADSISESSRQWTHFVAEKNQICANYGKADMLTDPETHQDILAMYYAYYDADEALRRYDVSDAGRVENGESRAHTLAYITSLKEYGTQNFDITGSSPLSLVLEKNGVKTYIAENVTDAEQRVYFSDGAYVDVPANSTYQGAKTGNGENPNVDESEILATKEKEVNVEVEIYREKVNGSGYDKTTGEVTVKSAEDTYTYVPEEQEGFTFEEDNSGNRLTVNISGGNAETVKVYYKRNRYTVKYHLNGGTMKGAETVTCRHGATVEPESPVREGYEFKGWYRNSDFTGKIITKITSIAEDMELYAKYEKVEEEPPVEKPTEEEPPVETPTDGKPPVEQPTDEKPPVENPPIDGTDKVIDAVAPVITSQPISRTGEYMSGMALVVAANVTDGGILNYQWYLNKTNSTGGGTIIGGATGATYQVPTDKIGTTYYYCVVTNINNNAEGKKTASVTSAAAKVDVTKLANPLLNAKKTYSKTIGSKKFTINTGAKGKVTFASSNKKVATVGKSNGKVKIRNTGKTTITVQTAGNAYYNAASKKITVIVTPKKVKITSVKASNNKTAVVKWKKVKKISGFEIQYATNKKFKKAQKLKVKKAATVATLKKLKAGKKYYVRVRAYKKSGKTTVRGAWSKPGTINS